jgi:hypothetical protein
MTSLDGRGMIHAIEKLEKIREKKNRRGATV